MAWPKRQVLGDASPCLHDRDVSPAVAAAVAVPRLSLGDKGQWAEDVLGRAMPVGCIRALDGERRASGSAVSRHAHPITVSFTSFTVAEIARQNGDSSVNGLGENRSRRSRSVGRDRSCVALVRPDCCHTHTL